MTETYPSSRNVLVVSSLLAAIALGSGCSQEKPATDDPSMHNVRAVNTLSDTCQQNPKGAITWRLGKTLTASAGLKAAGERIPNNKNVVDVHGNRHQLTVTMHEGTGERTVFPDMLTQKEGVMKFPYTGFGEVALAHLRGEAAVSFVLACDLQNLTEPNGLLAGQQIHTMPPLHNE